LGVLGGQLVNLQPQFFVLMQVPAMRVMVFTEGTILTHKNHIGLRRERIVELVKDQDGPLDRLYFAESVPIGKCVEKITAWKEQGATIVYLTSRRISDEVQTISEVLEKYKFPAGELLFRREGEEYEDVAEQALPDIIVEDDCESIGGEEQMTYPHIKQELKSRIKSVVVREFGGIDHLPSNISSLLNYR
jgi:hypothetical protein